MLAEGLGNKAIAGRLAISEHTVKTHVGTIFAKLGVSSRAEAVAIGARLGVLML
jgi:two-component system, NarL family, response regulator YdfI